MATNITGVAGSPALKRDGKTGPDRSGQQKNRAGSTKPETNAESAHTVDLSPESISKAQQIVTGGGYIASRDPGEIDFTDAQALALSDYIAGQMESRSGGLLQPPSAELAGLVG